TFASTSNATKWKNTSPPPWLVNFFLIPGITACGAGPLVFIPSVIITICLCVSGDASTDLLATRIEFPSGVAPFGCEKCRTQALIASGLNGPYGTASTAVGSLNTNRPTSILRGALAGEFDAYWLIRSTIAPRALFAMTYLGSILPSPAGTLSRMLPEVS